MRVCLNTSSCFAGVVVESPNNSGVSRALGSTTSRRNSRTELIHANENSRAGWRANGLRLVPKEQDDAHHLRWESQNP